MNIRGLGKPVEPVIQLKRDAVAKSDSATDRDANGQGAQGEEQQHPPMSDEQLAKALEHLKALAVFKEQNLDLEVTVVNDKKFVLIKERSGKVVRRIPEHELWSLMKTKEKQKGQLLSKSA